MFSENVFLLHAYIICSVLSWPYANFYIQNSRFKLVVAWFTELWKILGVMIVNPKIKYRMRKEWKQVTRNWPTRMRVIKMQFKWHLRGKRNLLSAWLLRSTVLRCRSSEFPGFCVPRKVHLWHILITQPVSKGTEEG